MPWRRLVTIPAFLLAWLAWIAALPLWLPIVIVVDLVRRNGGVALRSAAVVTVYLTCEAIGLAVSAALWIGRVVARLDDERWADLNWALEFWWGSTLFDAVARLFGLRLEIEGAEEAELARGPYLLLLRHASTADTLLGAAIVSRRYGTRLRYILKKEHLFDPCLDVAGHRVPNVFVDRASDDSAAEIRKVQALARGLGPRDGVLIYPEGTRFSEAKRARVLELFREKGDTRMLAYAESLEHVLPPRTGGTLGLLEAAPEADVIVCAHTGFEGTASLADVWRGALLHQTVRIEFRRIARHAIPEAREAQSEWLLDEWRRVGAWVAEHRDRTGGPGRATGARFA